MNEFKLGTYIKKRREELGISQEELCEGLCAVSSLSRIENNQQDPSRNLTKSLLERLGLPMDRFIALWDQKSISIGMLMREIRNDMVQYRRMRKEDQPLFREEIQKKLSELEATAMQDDRSIRQFLLATQAVLGGTEGPYNAKVRLAMELEAIRLTCPRFDPEDFRQGHYTMNETRLINQIANSYSEAGEKKRAIDIYRQLLWYIEKNDKELAGYAGHFCLVAQNYAIDLGTESYYSDAIEIAEQGRKVCIKYGDFQFLPGFLAIQGECYYFLGERAKSKKLYLQAFHVYNAFEDKTNREIICQEIMKYFGIEISDGTTVLF